ncbi:MAG TPA: endonuclease/exonuclease/phosphatase family protein [Pyrinomonadaceae bacterium]|nr:endonuclease/exonuclease/phosphatase family protein [Pyrinomonadaceae bacterium]
MLRKQKFIAAFMTLAILSITSTPVFADNRDRKITVMTYNMYPGTDFTDIFSAQTPGELVTEVAEAYTDVHLGNVPERIDEIADQIATASPDLVGLQEVALWRYGYPQDPAPATAVEFDFLNMLLDRLEARGHDYVPIAIQTNLDAELTGVFGPTSALDIRYTDRLVILARADMSNSELIVESTDAQHFATNLPVSVLGTTVVVYRGWTYADVKHRGKTYRFINSHLESFHEQVQLAQAVELLQGPANTNFPVIMSGDFNSDAASAGTVYGIFLGAGFNDVWNLMPTQTGFTWPLSGEIPNVLMTPTQRLDLILTRGTIEHSSVDVLGEDIGADLTPSGFRPSDHAGVKASFILQP